MGSSLQRLEVLIIGLIVLLAGAVVAIIMVLRPLSPLQYQPTTPQPIASSAAGGPASVPAQTSVTPLTAIPTAAPATAIPAATSAPQVMAAPAVTNTLSATALPVSITEIAPRFVLPSPAVLPTVRAIWPWLVLLAGPIGGLVVGMRIRRRRRMTYTNQSVGQLLATADAVTRDTNLKVMQDLAAQGLLTAELAAVAGIELAQPHQQRAGHLPTLRVPRLRVAWPQRVGVRLGFRRLLELRVSMPSLPRQRRQPLTIDMTSTMPVSPPASTNEMHDTAPQATAAEESLPLAIVTDLSSAAPAPTDVPLSDSAPAHGLPKAVFPTMPAAQDAGLAAVEFDTQLVTDEDADPWTSEERARAVANLIAELWAEATLHSPIMALDTPSISGGGQVRVTVDQYLDEVDRLNDVPERIVARRPTWRASWRRDALEVIVTTTQAPPPIGGPLIVPVLTHGRGSKITRYYPLASWRHLALYGSDALGALHAVLGSLLYAQPPAHLALAILDHGEITPLYRNVAHLAPLCDSPRATIEQLAQAIKRGARDDARPLVVVVVEPDDTMLNLLFGIAARLQARPTTPVHLLIAQECVSNAGRELYAMLPALIIGGGRGTTALLPGHGDWPKGGEARLVGRGMRAEGRAITWDEGAIAAAVAELRGQPNALPSFLWDTSVSLSAPPAAKRVADEQPRAVDVEDNDPENQVADVAPVEGVDEDDQDVLIVGDANEFVANNEPVDSADDRLAAQPLAGPVDEHEQRQSRTPAAIDHHSGSSEHASVADATTNATSEMEPRRRSPLYNRALDAGSANAPPMHLAPARRAAPSSTHESQPTVWSPLTTSAEPPPMVEPDNGFPVGPVPLGRVAMAELLAHMVATPAIVAGQANELGVTKNRLVDLLKGAHKAQAKALAEVLIVWLDLAGLLVEPTKPGRLRHPRALVTINLPEIAARLATIPCPDKETVTAMWAESHEGRN
jgi:hypothetical protein